MSLLYPESYQIKPMKYGKASEDIEEVRDLLNNSHLYIATLKVDGYHYEIEKTKSGHVYAFSRTISKKTGELTEKSANIPHIVKWVQETVPNDTVLCGEIYVPNGTSKDVTRIMGALPEKAIARQEKEGYVQYYIFDMLRYAGKDIMNLGYEQRYSKLCEHIDIELQHPDFIKVAISKTGFDTYETVQEWIAAGEEGAVCKRKDAPYEPDKRPKTCFKLKQAADNIDVVVTRLLDPEYLYSGKETSTWQYKDADGNLITKAAFNHWKNAFAIGAYDSNGKLIEFGTVASGISDTMCADMSSNPDKYIGQVVELNCMSVDKDRMSLRHPYVVKMRPDKPATDCKIEEIFS